MILDQVTEFIFFLGFMAMYVVGGGLLAALTVWGFRIAREKYWEWRYPPMATRRPDQQ